MARTVSNEAETGTAAPEEGAAVAPTPQLRRPPPRHVTHWRNRLVRLSQGEVQPGLATGGEQRQQRETTRPDIRDLVLFAQSELRQSADMIDYNVRGTVFLSVPTGTGNIPLDLQTVDLKAGGTVRYDIST